MKYLLGAIGLMVTAACAPTLQELGPAAATGGAEPVLSAEVYRTPDGRDLGLSSWAAEEPRAVIVALHGMNDYANAFAMPGAWWADHAGITTYAYDQRGFGRSPEPGIWAGGDLMVADLALFVDLVRARHPGLPVYLLGDSMGGSVVLAAMAEKRPPVDGVILVAPAVWGWSTLPLHYRVVLWLSARLMPGKTFTGKGLDIWPSDNIEMLRELSADPLVIKETRTDAIYGLVNLMERAYRAVPAVPGRTLVAYGEKDQIIPRRAVDKAIFRFCMPVRVAVYPDGYHMLLRDLQAETVWRDVAAWIGGQRRLPSLVDKIAHNDCPPPRS